MGKDVLGNGRSRRRCGAAARWLGIFLLLAAGVARVAASAVPGDRLRSLRIDGFYDPQRGFLEATARLRFEQPAGERRLWLADGLKLISARSTAGPVLDLTQEAGQFRMQCPDAVDLELSYSGRLDLDPFGEPGLAVAGNRQIDECHVLSYVNDFYPHPELDFAPLEMNIGVPSGWNLLGSGARRSVRPDGGNTTFQFASPGAKGVALVCGRFRQIGTVAGPLPIRLHAWDGFVLERYFAAAEIGRIIDFYAGKLGPLAAGELNIVFRRGGRLRGVSYSGLIVLNVDAGKPLRPALARPEALDEWPLALGEPGSDLLAHELAHQWWGGLVSWRDPADNWITEGLATYCSLTYLRQNRGDRVYQGALRRFRRWLKRFAGAGAASDGGKLRLPGRDLRAYQALVYAKPALMLAELAATVGAGELDRRLRAILESRRGSNLGSREFLEMLSAGDGRQLARLNEWIFATGLPQPQ
jgi:hypothetical protein